MSNRTQTSQKVSLFAELGNLLAVYLVDFSTVNDPLPDVKGQATYNHQLSGFFEAEHLLECCGIVGQLSPLNAYNAGENQISVGTGVVLSRQEIEKHVGEHFSIVGRHLDWLIYTAINLMSDYANPLGSAARGTFPFEVPSAFAASFKLLCELEYSSKTESGYVWNDKGYVCFWEDSETLPTLGSKQMFLEEINQIWRGMPDKYRAEFKWPTSRHSQGLIANHWYDGVWNDKPIPVLEGSGIGPCSPAFSRAIAVSKIADPDSWN
jgi:hypothetical protein